MTSSNQAAIKKKDDQKSVKRVLYTILKNLKSLERRKKCAQNLKNLKKNLNSENLMGETRSRITGCDSPEKRIRMEYLYSNSFQ